MKINKILFYNNFTLELYYCFNCMVFKYCLTAYLHNFDLIFLVLRKSYILKREKVVIGVLLFWPTVK